MSLPPKRVDAKTDRPEEARPGTACACPVRMSPAFADEALASAMKRSNDQLIPAALVLDVHYSQASSTLLNGLPVLLARVDSDRQLSQIRCYFGKATGPEPLRWLEYLIKLFSEYELTKKASLTVQVPFALVSQPWSRALSQLPISELQIDCHDAIDTSQLPWQRNFSKLRSAIGAVGFCVKNSIPESTLMRLLCATPESVNVNADVLAAAWLRQQLLLPASESELQEVFSFSKREIIAGDFVYCGLGAYRRESLAESCAPTSKGGPVDLLCFAPGGLMRLGEWVFRVMPDLAGPDQLVAGGGCLSSELLSQEDAAMSLLQNVHSSIGLPTLQRNSKDVVANAAYSGDMQDIERSASSHFAVSDTQLFATRQ